MQMILPIRIARFTQQQLVFALNFQLASRQKNGVILNQIILPKVEKRGYLGVSSLGTPSCALHYSLNNAAKEKADPGSQFGFDTGNILESYILDLLQIRKDQRQIDLAWPYELAPGGEIKGHPDGVLSGLLPGGSCVIECKATGGYSFAKKQEEGPDQGHIEQAFCYASRLRAPLFALIYANREAKKSTPFYQVFAYRIPDQLQAALAVQSLFDLRFKPALRAKQRPAPPAETPKYEIGPRGWRCRPDTSYFARGKKNNQVGYCSYRPVCPEALGYLDTLRRKEKEKEAA